MHVVIALIVVTFTLVAASIVFLLLLGKGYDAEMCASVEGEEYIGCEEVFSKGST